MKTPRSAMSPAARAAAVVAGAAFLAAVLSVCQTAWAQTPSTPPLDSTASKSATAISSGQVPVLAALIEDIALQPPDQRLQGCVLANATSPTPGQVAGLPVRLIHGGQQIAQTRTDPWGRFGLSNLRAGVYQVAIDCPGATVQRTCRFWTGAAAPPSARPSVVVPLSNPVIRAQLTVPAVTFGQAALFTGIVAGAIAPPIIYNNAQQANRVPVSP